MPGLFDFLRRARTPKLSPRQARGRVGEETAEKFLQRHGHRVIARNVTYPQGEVDLITRDKRADTLCFVEVRSRNLAAGEVPRVTPEESVTPAKARRVVRAARQFLTERDLRDVAVRFDVVTVIFTDGDHKHPDIRHYPSAFDARGKAT